MVAVREGHLAPEAVAGLAQGGLVPRGGRSGGRRALPRAPSSSSVRGPQVGPPLVVLVLGGGRPLGVEGQPGERVLVGVLVLRVSERLSSLRLPVSLSHGGGRAVLAGREGHGRLGAGGRRRVVAVRAQGAGGGCGPKRTRLIRSVFFR